MACINDRGYNKEMVDRMIKLLRAHRDELAKFLAVKRELVIALPDGKNVTRVSLEGPLINHVETKLELF